MTSHDRTMDEISAYASDRWCAARLGQSLDWFKRNRETLEREGFPQKDRLFALTLKADVEAFLAKRARVAQPSGAAIHEPLSQGVNLNEL